MLTSTIAPEIVCAMLKADTLEAAALVDLLEK
jgi:hypothetical protein